MALVAEAPTAAQWPREHYEQAIQNSQPRRVMLVLEDQTIQAFLVARSVADEWELENIAVDANVRRQGTGLNHLQRIFADRPAGEITGCVSGSPRIQRGCTSLL